MKHMFETSGFRPASMFTGGGGRSLRLGTPIGIRMGDPVSQVDRDGMLSIIKSGTARIAAVRKWIASKIDQDPMLARTFNDSVVQSNFWSFDDLVNSDQWAIDAAYQNLASSDPSAWDLSEDVVARVGDWGKAVDTMYAGMQQYGGGGSGGIVKMGPVGPTGVSAPAASALKNPPAPVAGGFTTGQLVVGGAVLLAAGLVISSII